LERVKFLAIYSNNLGEFFSVRIAHHRNLIQLRKKERKELHVKSRALLKQIIGIVQEQQIEYNRIFREEIIPALKNNNIRILNKDELSPKQLDFINGYFQDHMLPYVQPVLLRKNKIRPFLNNSQLYLMLNLKDKTKEKANPDYALVKIPSDHLPRFIILPSEEGQHDTIYLDDVVRQCIPELFPGYEILDSNSIKLTRDAALYLDDEYAGDLISKIKESLIRRNVGPPSRLVYDRAMPKDMLDYIINVLDIEELALVEEGKYHNNFDFFRFPDFDKPHLENQKLKPLPFFPLEQTDRFFDLIKEKDRMLHVPYHSYESVIRFFEEAAADPSVTHIKIVQYRVASKSRIMEALKRAVRNGKRVSAFIEAKARFDEEANLRWGAELEKAGVKVHYSFPGLKVHAKAALVRRMENEKQQFYCYFSTGNFHEGTARLYCDLGVFTADERLTHEATRLFSFLETVRLPAQNFKHILVGQFNMRQTLIDMILLETEAAKRGQPAKIQLKLNSMQDKEMVELLYKASQEGVKIDLIIRGICSIVPGIKGISENINCISIVDRFLEHARIYIFHNGGDEKIYIASADWMVRNLKHRIETAVPIYDTDLRAEIRHLMDIQLKDNVKARYLDADKYNKYVRDDAAFATRAQIEAYFYYRRRDQLGMDGE
jgi:polyphosphate kinase